MKYLVAFLLLLLGVHLAYSQDCEYTLHGKIIDFHDGSPLLNAIAKVSDSEKFAYSDINGEFTIDNLCTGVVTIEIMHPECENAAIDVTINGNTTKVFKMEHHLEQLSAVTVTSNKVQNTTTGNEQKLQTEAIEKYSSFSLTDALKQVSGVSSLNSGDAIVKPVIQGLHSSRVLTLNNGVRMEDQEWGIEHAPNVDINTAGSLSVIKGASALQYGGDAIGGVVLVNPEPIYVKDSIFGKSIISLSSNGMGSSTSSTLTQTFKNGFYWGVQGTIKRFGDFEAPEYVLSNTGYSEKDFSVKFGLKKFTYGFNAFYSYFNTNIAILRASHIGNVSDLVNAINSDEPLFIRDFTYALDAPEQKVEHHLAKLEFYKRFSGLGKLTLQYNYQNNYRREFDIRVGDDKYKPAVDLLLTTQRVNSNFKIDALENVDLNFGIEGMYQENVADPSTGVRRLIPDYTKYGFGAFAIANYQLSDKLLVEAGFRYDYSQIDALKFYLKNRWEQQGYDDDFSDIIIEDFGTQYLTNPVFDYNNFSYTAGLNYKFNNNYNVKFNYAKASRAPNPSELFSDGLHQSVAAIELGSLRIGSEYSQKFSLIFAKNSGDFTFNIAPYYNPIDDFIYIEPTGIETTIRGAFPVYEYTQVNANLWGVDLDASYRLSKNFTYNGRFAYVRGEDRDRNEALIDIPPANLYNAITFNNTTGKGYSLTLRSDYVFRQNHYPDNNFFYQVIQDGQLVSTLVDVSTPPDAYFLLGMDFNTGFNLFRNTSMDVGLSVNNILNTAYRDYLNRLRYFADNSGRNINIQIKFNY
ncbi:TonB-dependent receptor [Galbibacter sp. BG1]|uniref:TonB-dependent receptor n=1 Tax=Galbibacter sp. BG1 TaxID=1170699 RepID=UPI0015BF0807|nr:TonB-dependent receptor [Galbibacter sp. BG1]QLE03010.1 TonB-dependent receptor [Galbibacter sp. BG1]